MGTIYGSNNVPLRLPNHYHGADFPFFTTMRNLLGYVMTDLLKLLYIHIPAWVTTYFVSISALSRGYEICDPWAILSRILTSTYCLIIKQIFSFQVPILAFFPRLLHNQLYCLKKQSFKRPLIC